MLLTEELSGLSGDGLGFFPFFKGVRRFVTRATPSRFITKKAAKITPAGRVFKHRRRMARRVKRRCPPGMMRKMVWGFWGARKLKCKPKTIVHVKTPIKPAVMPKHYTPPKKVMTCPTGYVRSCKCVKQGIWKEKLRHMRGMWT